MNCKAEPSFLLSVHTSTRLLSVTVLILSHHPFRLDRPLQNFLRFYVCHSNSFLWLLSSLEPLCLQMDCTEKTVQ
jgi:hypothetical protein